MLNSENAVRLRVLLGFLKAGRVLDHGSSVLLLATLLLGMQARSWPMGLALGGALLLGLVEKYLAWRVALDVEFFTLLHEQPGQETAFDAELAAFLGRPMAVGTRSMVSRWQGARRLVRAQALALGAQAVVLLGAWAGRLVGW